MSCIERCPHFRGKCPLRKYIQDTARRPYTGRDLKKVHMNLYAVFILGVSINIDSIKYGLLFCFFGQ